MVVHLHSRILAWCSKNDDAKFSTFVYDILVATIEVLYKVPDRFPFIYKPLPCITVLIEY